jgi:hypothetical protein
MQPVFFICSVRLHMKLLLDCVLSIFVQLYTHYPLHFCFDRLKQRRCSTGRLMVDVPLGPKPLVQYWHGC